jgi:hypothetical protein
MKASWSNTSVSFAIPENRVHPLKCETCKRRRYICSNAETSDGKVVKLDREEEMVRVWSHEREHARLARLKARREGREIVYIRTGIDFGYCPECGRRFVKGGRTIVRTKPLEKRSNMRFEGIGRSLDMVG